ncbi:MAG: HlyC/CorC family transporter, partial [Caldithrix sp.]
FMINEILAKFVLKKNRLVAEFLSFPAMVYFTLISPFIGLLARLFQFFSNMLDVSRKSTVLEHHKIMALVEDREENGGLEDNERAMIDSIFEFGETEVHEIMIPRIDIVGVEENISLENLTKLIKSKGHSRIPLYNEGLDNILGIIHAKDLLPIIINGKTDIPDLKKLARPASFVPESKKLHHLLKEFQKKRQHMTIVVDEYGGTAGLVTLEDVLEEIVGEIQDEYDKEPPLYKKIDENCFLVDAKIDLDELNEELEMDLPTEGEYESLGGFIFSLTDYVPEQNEVVKYNNYRFLIKKIDRNRIIQVELTRSKDVEDGKKGSGGV